MAGRAGLGHTDHGDALAAECQQVGQGQSYSEVVAHGDAVDVVMLVLSQDDDRAPSSLSAQTLWSQTLPVEDDAVELHVAVEEVLLGLTMLSGHAEDHGQVVAGGGGGDAVGELSEEGLAQFRDRQADHPRAPGAEVGGGTIGGVVQAGHRLQDLAASGFGDSRFIVDHARDGLR